MAKGLPEILGGVQKTKNSYDEAVKTARDEIEAVKNSILGGEDSTGSNFHDGIISLYGSELIDNPEIVGRYERVLSELQAAEAGAPFVLLHRVVIEGDRIMHVADGVIEPLGHSGHSDLFGPPDDKAVDIETDIITVGLVPDGNREFTFDYAKDQCVMPAGRVASRKGGRSGRVETNHGGVLVRRSFFNSSSQEPRIDLGTNLDQILTAMSGSLHLYFEKSPALSIAFGLDAIQALFADKDDHQSLEELDTIRKLCERIAIKPIEPATDYQRRMLLPRTH